MGAWAGAGYGWQGLWLVAGRAGFWGALATWVGVNSSSPLVPTHPWLREGEGRDESLIGMITVLFA